MSGLPRKSRLASVVTLTSFPARAMARHAWQAAFAALVFATRAGGFAMNHTSVNFFRKKLSSPRLETTALALLQAPDSPCSGPHSITRDQCLSKTGASCMWLDLGEKNVCLPCEWEGIDIPCAPVKTFWGGHQVKDCVMSCHHQKILTKISSCTDVSGGISTTQCFQKGITADEQCMWTAYTTKTGEGKSVCGPCNVGGIGQIPCYNAGDKGPEGGSSVDGCVSQCEGGSETNDVGIPCDSANGVPAVPNCFPTPAPPPPGKVGTLPLEVLKIATRPGAPEYFATAVDPPYGPREYTAAAALAARAAGWPDDGSTGLPPDRAMVIFGPPPKEAPTLPPTIKVMYGPAPPGIPGIPPPGYGMGTAPPPNVVKAAYAQDEGGFIQTATRGASSMPQLPGSPPPGSWGPPPPAAAASGAMDGTDPVVLVESPGSREAPMLRGIRGGSTLGVPGSLENDGPQDVSPDPFVADPAPPLDAPYARTIW